MLSAVLVVVAILWPGAAGRTIPHGSMEPSVSELQRLEAVLENAALEENTIPLQEVKRVVRERPVEAEETRRGAVNLEAAGTLTNHLEDEKKRVVRERPSNEQEVRDSKDSKTSADRGERHFHSGGSPLSYPAPHVTFNVPASQVSYSIAPQAPIPPPRPNCVGGGCSGGTTIHVQDTHLVTQHLPQTYTATVPFVSGYRLTPVIGQKQITLHDWYHGASGVGVGGSGGCTPEPWGGYWQHLYNHARSANSWTAEDLLRPFEDARYFQSPLDQEHNLSDHTEYTSRIDDLKHHIEHLESLRENVSGTMNPPGVAPAIVI